MVNSKKMSKSTVAIVLLSLLLVLSLILTATGAWFTATDKQDSGAADLKFGNLSVAGSVTDMEVKLNGAEWAKVTEGTTIVMPGDKVRGGVYTFTITTNDRAGAYYLLKSGDKYYTVEDGVAKEYTTGNLTAVALTGTETITFGGVGAEGAYVGGAEGSAVSNDKQNESVSVAAGSYTIYVIQASNIAADGAAAQIKGLVEGGFPANKA